MNTQTFLVVGENVHCSRIVKRGGKHCSQLSDGREGIAFTNNGQKMFLPVPWDWEQHSSAYAEGRLKHIGLALHLIQNGSAEEQELGKAYVLCSAQAQVNAGAHYLDVNVDEYSSDPATNQTAMRTIASLLCEHIALPLSIDSSDPTVLEAGLSTCACTDRPLMLNSVSLERLEAVELAARFGTQTIVSAAGETAMPGSIDERLENVGNMLEKLASAGVPTARLHVDPLVLPISTDPQNGTTFLEATRRIADAFPGVHLTGGLSNISFGMPARRLLNMTFVRLCLKAGTNGGIIDPVATSPDAILALDLNSQPCKLAQAVLTGEDMFGMEFITAHRDGRLKG